MNAILLVPAIIAAIGVGLIVLGVGRYGMEVYHTITRKRMWYHMRAKKEVVEENIYGVPPLLPWILVGAVLGLVMGRALLTGPMQNLGPLAGLLPLLWKQQRIREGKQQVRREVADLVEELRLYLAFASTPGAALRLVVDNAPEGVLWDQLRREKDTITIDGPEAALENVARRLEVPALDRLVTRVRASRAGATDLTAALRAAAEEVARDLQQEIEEHVEAAPTRLLVPMLVTLMVPLLIIVLTPPVATLLATLTGVGPTPLGW